MTGFWALFAAFVLALVVGPYLAGRFVGWLFHDEGTASMLEAWIVGFGSLTLLLGLISAALVLAAFASMY